MTALKIDMQKIVELSPQPLILADTQGHIIFCNRVAEHIFPPEKITRNIDFIIKAVQDTQNSPDNVHVAGMLETSNGNIFFIRWQVSILDLNNEKFYLFTGTDLTDTYQQEEELSFKVALMEEVSDMVMVHNWKGRLLYYNQAVLSVLGYSKEELLDMHASMIDQDQLKMKHVLEQLRDKGHYIFISKYTKKNGQTLYVEVSSKLLTYRGRNVILSIARDITKRKVIQDKLKTKQKELIILNHQLKLKSERDNLTGLYNRLYFEHIMEDIEGVRKNYPISIVMIDLDHLKLINDTLGHSSGDMIIKKGVNIIKSNFRADDIIARIGGDEFAVIMPKTNEHVAEQKAKKLTAAILKELLEPLPVMFSIGYATTENMFCNLYDVFREADANMYRQKEINRERTLSILQRALSQLKQPGHTS